MDVPQFQIAYQKGMVLFLIVRSDQEINKTLSALSVFAVQHFPDLL